MEKIKVLLAIYNGEKYIEEQIDSILKQENVLVDICVSDDNSKDKTLDIIREKYPSIFIKKNKPSTGSAANNFLKMLVETDFEEKFDYIAFSDQDDIWLPKKLDQAVHQLKEQKADLYCSNLTKWDMKTGEYSILKKDFPQKKFDYIFEGGSAGCTYVFTKSLGQKLRDFVQKLDVSDWEEFSHDWLIYFFARSRDYRVFIDGNSYIHYRIHDNNVHGHLNKLSIKSIIDKFSKVLRGYHREHIKNYIKYLDKDSEAHTIANDFLGNYFQRNRMIWKYNTQLMRDKKKFVVFLLLNIIKIK